MSLVVPAFNEEERLGIMLAEATEYLQQEYGDADPTVKANGNLKKRKGANQHHANGHASSHGTEARGWEVLVVSDGSTDKTVDTALQFARDLGGLAAASIRVIQLHENRGKGGAVTHGMRHVRGQYAIFADADGASKFQDLGKLVRDCKRIEGSDGRGVAVGSRAHLVGSEAVVKVETPDPVARKLSADFFFRSDLSSAISSCTRSTCSSASSLLPPQPLFETPNAASNSSLAPR